MPDFTVLSSGRCYISIRKELWEPAYKIDVDDWDRCQSIRFENVTLDDLKAMQKEIADAIAHEEGMAPKRQAALEAGKKGGVNPYDPGEQYEEWACWQIGSIPEDDPKPPTEKEPSE